MPQFQEKTPKTSEEIEHGGVHSDIFELYRVTGAYFKFNAFQTVMCADRETGLIIVVLGIRIIVCAQ
jgi:hypothetical protein